MGGGGGAVRQSGLWAPVGRWASSLWPGKASHTSPHTQNHTHILLMQVKDGVKTMGATGAGAAVCIPGQVCVASPD